MCLSLNDAGRQYDIERRTPNKYTRASSRYVVAAARWKMYTGPGPGSSHSADCGVPALRVCVEPSARGYFIHEFPFVVWVRETGVVDGNRVMEDKEAVDID